MARARNVKPALFENEVLGMADPLCTLLFIGLWTLADCEGRLEDRPLRIKAQLFPYRHEVEIEKLLEWLRENRFIYRYSRAGFDCIQIVNFCKHQNPHKNEKSSELPEYVEGEVCVKKHAEFIDKKELSRNYSSDTEKIGTARADSLLMIPDSLNLIPDSLECVCNSDTILCEGEESAANAATPTRPNAEKTQDNINPNPVLREDDKPVGSAPTASIRQKAVKTQGKKVPQKIKFADDVTLTEAEHAALIEAYGEKTTAELIEILSNYKGSKGTSYKSDYKAIKSWVVKAWTERNKASPQPPKTLNGKPIPQRSKTNPFWNMLVDDMEKQSDEQTRSSEIIDVD